MGFRDLKVAEKYILIGRLLKKGLKNNQLDKLIKLLAQQNNIDKIINALLNLLNMDSEKKQQKVIKNEINIKKQKHHQAGVMFGTIVLAEKNPQYTELLKKGNISRDYYIVHIPNNISGLEIIEKVKPKLAVLDFDTYFIFEKYESLDNIKRQFKNVPIIMLCNNIPDNTRERANINQLITYIQKPVDSKKLEQIIKKKLQKLKLNALL